jgi:hypothetical protein
MLTLRQKTVLIGLDEAPAHRQDQAGSADFAGLFTPR